jgi:hypothetical protein
MSVDINEGTQTTINTVQIGGTETQIVRIDVGSGTAESAWVGKVAVTAGTMAVTLGTIANGSIAVTSGTISTIGIVHADKFATVISTGTSAMGTIKAAVSGSAIYVTDLIVSAGTATNVEIGNGGTDKPLIGTMHFDTNGGAVMNMVTPIATTAGSALIYKQSVDGPLTITCLGYVD